MRTLIWILALGGFVHLVLNRIARRRRVSHAWMTDNDRREWNQGQEGICWNWPVRK